MKVRVVVAALGALAAMVRPGAAEPPAPAAIQELRLEDAISPTPTRRPGRSWASSNDVTRARIGLASSARCRSAPAAARVNDLDATRRVADAARASQYGPG